MDDALVEAAAFTLEAHAPSSVPVPFIRVLDEKDKMEAVKAFFGGKHQKRTFLFERVLDELYACLAVRSCISFQPIWYTESRLALV